MELVDLPDYVKEADALIRWQHITIGRGQMLVEVLQLSVAYKDLLPLVYVQALRRLDPSCQDPKPLYPE
jgi:hypothetical protein